MEINKALFISQEINPYLNPTTMSVLCREVPQKLQEHGAEVRTFMPKYGSINERRNQLHEVIRLSGLNIIIDDNDHPLIIKVATLQPSRMQVYFIDNDDFFERTASELETNLSPEDNDERMIFFTMGVVETVRKLRWYPTLVHCSGWITSLIPMVIKIKYPGDPAFKDAKIVYSMFGNPFEGALDPRLPEKLRADGYTDEQIAAIKEGDIDFIAINRLGIDYSDAIVQATEDVPQELIDYAIASGKPFLPFPGLDNKEAYIEFYNSL